MASTSRRTAQTVEQSGVQGGEDPEISQSYYLKLRKGPKSAKSRPFPTNTNLNYNSSITSGAAGRLHAGQIVTPTDNSFRAMLTKLVAQSPDTFEAGTVVNPVAPGIGNSAIEIYYMSTEMMVDFTNLQNTGLHLEIYECHAKRQGGNGPLNSIYQGLAETQGHDAKASMTAFLYPVGTKPTDSEEFKNLWEIDWRRKLYLGAGDTHRHRHLVAPHVKIPPASIQVTGGDDTNRLVNKHSRAIFWFCWGAPMATVSAGVATVNVNDSSTETHFMTTAGVQMGVMMSTKERFSMLEFSPGGDIDVQGSLWPIAPGRIREADGDEVDADQMAW